MSWRVRRVVLDCTMKKPWVCPRGENPHENMKTKSTEYRIDLKRMWPRRKRETERSHGCLQNWPYSYY